MAYAHDLISNSTTHLHYHFSENIILFSLVLIVIFTLKKFFIKTEILSKKY